MEVEKSATNLEIEAALARIDTMIRQLKVQYQMFFAGSLKREPVEARSQLDRLIRRYQNTTMPTNLRFHFNTLHARYNSYSELWGKTVRSLEEGVGAPGPAVARSARPETKATSGPRARGLVASCQLTGAGDDANRLREVYDRFVEAREKAGAGKSPSFDRFVKGVTGQADQLQKKSGCAEIELRVVVKDRKVQLEARPRRS